MGREGRSEENYLGGCVINGDRKWHLKGGWASAPGKKLDSRRADSSAKRRRHSSLGGDKASANTGGDGDRRQAMA